MLTQPGRFGNISLNVENQIEDSVGGRRNAELPYTDRLISVTPARLAEIKKKSFLKVSAFFKTARQYNGVCLHEMSVPFSKLASQ